MTNWGTACAWKCQHDLHHVQKGCIKINLIIVVRHTF